MRRFIPGSLVLLILLCWALLTQAPAVADELVRFASAAPVFPQAFSIRNGASLPRSETPIQGYLSRPKGKGPFPAVVLLHSCLGLPSNRREIGDTLASWGYAALFVDDFGTRGLGDTCTVDFPEGLADAFGALEFVATLPGVDRTRIAAVGFSQGGDTALELASGRFVSDFAVPNGLAFRVVAAFYPPCGNDPGARLRLPTLIAVGEADSVTPVAYCRQLARAQPPGADVRLIVYPGAGHVFDDPAFVGGKRVLGMWLQYDRKAAEASRSALRAFLAAELAR
jgi:dienelactone hydrolase